MQSCHQSKCHTSGSPRRSRKVKALKLCLCQVFPKKLVSFSTWIDHTRWARNTWAMAAIFILTMANIMDMVRFSLMFPTTAEGQTSVWICIYFVS